MRSDDTAGQQKGLLSAGAGLLWRRQSVLCWLFAVNVVLGRLGTWSAGETLNGALGYSLAGNQLLKGFDVGMLYEVIRLPGTNFLQSRFAAYGCAILFAVFVLFVSGGILEAFRQDRKLNSGDFFAASGAFFWRFVRLTLFMLVPFAFLGFAYPQVRSWSESLGDKAVADQVGVVILAAGVVVLGILALCVRMWFDIAKVRMVAESERGAWDAMWKALDITFRHLGTLLWMYVRISVVAAITLLVGFLIWTKLPPTATPAIFILLEFILLSQLAVRLWQLASVTEWYRRYAEVVPAELTIYQPQPEEVIEPAETPALPEPDLPPLREPETPPAEA
jgi:hypothetical protein